MIGNHLSCSTWLSEQYFCSTCAMTLVASFSMLALPCWGGHDNENLDACVCVSCLCVWCMSVCLCVSVCVCVWVYVSVSVWCLPVLCVGVFCPCVNLCLFIAVFFLQFLSVFHLLRTQHIICIISFCSSTESWSIHLQLTTHFFCTHYILFLIT